MEVDPVFETLCFLVVRIPDDGQSPEAVILSIHFQGKRARKEKEEDCCYSRRFFQAFTQHNACFCCLLA
jgi:hypothetical protein